MATIFCSNCGREYPPRLGKYCSLQCEYAYFRKSWLLKNERE